MASDSIKARNEAQQFCVQRGAELVKITSRAENDFVLALAREKAPSVQQVWIGLQYQRSVRAFYWSDNSVLTYNNWAPHEPSGNGNEQCGHMWTRRTTFFPARASGYWNDISCATKKVFPNGLVCKKLAAYWWTTEQEKRTGCYVLKVNSCTTASFNFRIHICFPWVSSRIS